MVKVNIQGEVEDTLRRLSNESGMSIAQIVTKVLQKFDIEVHVNQKIKVELNDFKISKEKKKIII